MVFTETTRKRRNHILTRVLISVSAANSMSRELDKRVRHELVLVSPQMRGQSGGQTEIFVHTVGLDNPELSFFASKDEFMNRKFVMQEMHQDFLDGEVSWDKDFEDDPFFNNLTNASLLGYAHLYIAR